MEVIGVIVGVQQSSQPPTRPQDEAPGKREKPSDKDRRRSQK